MVEQKGSDSENDGWGSAQGGSDGGWSDYGEEMDPPELKRNRSSALEEIPVFTTETHKLPYAVYNFNEVQNLKVKMIATLQDEYGFTDIVGQTLLTQNGWDLKKAL